MSERPPLEGRQASGLQSFHRPPIERRRSNRPRIRYDDLERRPLLLQRQSFSHQLDQSPLSSSRGNPHSNLPVYTNIHRIRRDVTSIVEDYLSLDQLRDMRINVSVVRPLVDKLYELDDISIVYCLMVNRAHFLHEQAHTTSRKNVNHTRAMLCELVATRILRRFSEDNNGDSPTGLLVLANILVAGFEPFQGAPDEIREQHPVEPGKWDFHSTLPALEIAILSEAKLFLSSTSCQKVVNAIYEGRVIYTPSSFLDIIPDRYKQKPISLYNPREAPLLNQYRLIVPRNRNIIEIFQFIVLLALYLAFMSERDPSRLSWLEVCFAIYALGWTLDNFATILEHGWRVYTQNLWSFLDVMFALAYGGYIGLRIHGWLTNSEEVAQQALDVLAIGAPVLVPRLAFNLLSDNLLFVSLRAMMSDFALLTVLAAWCFLGFLLSLSWLGSGAHPMVTISKWMIYIWFGLDGTGIQRSAEFHQILGPSIMVTYAFLGNTLFLTILVAMLTNTFSTIATNATAEILYRRAVLTLEGVKSDAIFAYQPPFNIIALLTLVPLKFIVSPRWFHKIHVASVRFLNLPLLLIIAAAERRLLAPTDEDEAARAAPPRYHRRAGSKTGGRFWEKWRITTHSEIHAVFESPPPASLSKAIAVDDEMTSHLIRRQFAKQSITPEHSSLRTTDGAGEAKDGQGGRESKPRSRTHSPGSGSATPARSTATAPPPLKPPTRRDSIGGYEGLAQEIRGALNGSDEIYARLDSMEEAMERMETLLLRLVGDEGLEEAGGEELDPSVDVLDEADGEGTALTGTLADLDRAETFLN